MAIVRGARGPGGSGLTNPMTTAGDIIVGGASGTPARLGIGTEGQALLVTGGEPMWSPLPSGGIDTSLQPAPDTGWTASGDGTAAVASGIATYTITDAQGSALLMRDSNSSPFSPATELIARVTLTTTPAAGAHWQWIGMESDDAALGYRAQVDSTGIYVAFYSSSSYTFITSAGVASAWSGGQLWLRIVVSAAFVAFFQGTGASIPSTWTLLAARATSSPDMRDVIGAGKLTKMTLGAGRAGGGTGDFECTATDIQWRSLLGAPT